VHVTIMQKVVLSYVEPTHTWLLRCLGPRNQAVFQDVVYVDTWEANVQVVLIQALVYRWC
jgi:hypothetical protein